MKIGEKMFPGSIVALLLGVLLAAPLLYTNMVVGPVTAGSEQLFNVDLTYAYIEENRTNSESPVISYFVASNITRLSEDIDPCDAKILAYLVKFYSDNGFVENLGLFQGILYNNELVASQVFNLGLLVDFFKSTNISGDSKYIVGGGSFGTLDIGESSSNGLSGTSPILNSTSEEPTTMSIKISLLGWISITGNSTNTVVLQEAEVVMDVQMGKFGDGFLYNKLIPEDQLSNLDPLTPYGKLFELTGDWD